MATSFSGSGEQLRRANLSAVLALVHDVGQVSRADITEATGLNRSTVSRIVGRLVELDLVAESQSVATNRVGRPSPTVRAHPSPSVLAVNPEIDAVTVALVGMSARMLHSTRVEVDHAPSPAETARIVAETLAGWPAAVLDGRRMLGVGLAVPGLVRANREVRWAPHLQWTDVPLAELFDAALGLPAWVGNDASLGALAEWRYGAGRNVDDLVYLNAGASGIGGGVIADGNLLGGSRGYAGEFGHTRVRQDDAGDLESEVNRSTILDALGMRSADEVTLERAALSADAPLVHAELARQRAVLSVSLANAVSVLNPATIVLGGYLGTVYSSGPDDLGALVAGRCEPAIWQGTTICRAALGADVLLIGAAELAWRSLIAVASDLWDSPAASV